MPPLSAKAPRKRTLRAAGVPKRQRKQIRQAIRQGKPSGLKAAGVTDQRSRQAIRRGIRGRSEARAAQRQQMAQKQERRVRRIMPQGIRGSRRTGGGR